MIESQKIEQLPMSEKSIDFPAKLIYQPTQNFIEQVASSAPAPGGGSAAALSGAVGAALLSMVCALTIGKKDYAEVEQELQEVRTRTEAARAKLTRLIDDDTTAFNRLRVARKLPSRNDAEKKAKEIELTSASQETIEVPLTTMQSCLGALREAPVVAEKGNENCVSDSGAGACQLYAGLEGGAFNVLINLIGADEDAETKQLREKVRAAREEGRGLFERTIQIVTEKLHGTDTNPA
ncbi:MAG: cyclodeaminase/cyclohydrolase family protein [bacterium]